MDYRFWMVFRDNFQMVSTVRHPSREIAIAEAQRLASVTPNTKFYVAAFTGFATYKPQPAVDWVDMEKAR